jgi:hypothetical protein
MRTSPLASDRAQRYYTPWQICVATLIGGPLAGGFLTSRDHALFGASHKATATMLISTCIVVAAVALGSRMQPNAGETAIAALIAIGYRWYAHFAFTPEISLRQSRGWSRQSWWQVIWISLAFVLGLALIVIVALVISGGVRPA